MIDRGPFAMLFIRCKFGISHHPAAFIAARDAALAVAVLTDCLTRFDPRVSTQGPSQ
jgi:allantoate deiminase